MNYWLVKSEPDEFGIDDLETAKAQTTTWNGVRNFQARNYLRSMAKRDQAFFYHSSCAIPGIVGVMEVISEAYPDPTQFDLSSPYFDARATVSDPKWFAVDFKLIAKAANPFALQEMRNIPKLHGMIILRKGNRLSVTPVEAIHWAEVRRRLER